MSIREALAAMMNLPLRRAATERIPLAGAEGRILAERAIAPEDAPPFRRSRVDGYAVRAADVRTATIDRPARLRIAGDVAMGRPAPGPLEAGFAMRIPTGGALPDGADGVVMKEDASLPAGREGFVDIADGAGCEGNVTAAGADVQAGAALFERGRVLSPAALGLLAAVGIAEVAVYVRPVVGILVTGDELVAPGEPLGPGEIRDINRYSLAAALTAMGFAPRTYAKVRDDRAAFARAFGAALAECDAVLISGGSSVGERDYTPEVVAQAGEPGVIVHGIRAKPGRPMLLAAIGDKPVLGLPGNPVSALIVLEAIAKPILLRLFDKEDATLPWRARLDQTIDVEPTLEHRIAVTIHRDGDRLVARPLFGTSAQMHILAFADAVVVVPEGVGRIEAGSWVDAVPLTRGHGVR